MSIRIYRMFDYNLYHLYIIWGLQLIRRLLFLHFFNTYSRFDVMLAIFATCILANVTCMPAVSIMCLPTTCAMCMPTAYVMTLIACNISILVPLFNAYRLCWTCQILMPTFASNNLAHVNPAVGKTHANHNLIGIFCVTSYSYRVNILFEMIEIRHNQYLSKWPSQQLIKTSFSCINGGSRIAPTPECRSYDFIF